MTHQNIPSHSKIKFPILRGAGNGKSNDGNKSDNDIHN